MSNGAVFVLVENHKNICGKVNFILSITVVQKLPATFRFWSAVAQCLYIPPPKIKSKLKTVCNSLRLAINAFFGSPLFLWFKHATRVHISNTHLKTNSKRKQYRTFHSAIVNTNRNVVCAGGGGNFFETVRTYLHPKHRIQKLFFH